MSLSLSLSLQPTSLSRLELDVAYTVNEREERDLSKDKCNLLKMSKERNESPEETTESGFVWK